MRISDSQRLLFVHVQKTGGSSVRNVLAEHLDDVRPVRGPKPRKHMPLAELLEREPVLAGYWIFGFVRNPWDRMVSWWSMISRRREQAATSEHIAWQLRVNPLWRRAATYPDFETFVLRGTEEFPEMRTPQVDLLTVPDGRRADFIGRQETFAADMRAVLARFALPVPARVRRVNTSRHTHYAGYFTARTRDLVGELYRPDLDAFGYDFVEAAASTT